MIEDAEATTLFAALKDGGSLVYLHKASNSIAKLMLVRKIQGLAGTQELLEIPYGA
jgi:hypothetical protein